jgi:chromosome segregation ATPase
LLLASRSTASAVNPISQVLELISGMQAKIIAEGEAAHKAYAEYAEWCDDRHREVGFEIKTGKADIEDLSATIAKAAASIQASEEKVGELVASISKDEATLKEATAVRATENADFVAVEKESQETISALERAIGILEKGGAAFAQVQKAGSFVQAMSVMVQTLSISSADAGRLTALVQSSSDDDEDDTGAPAAAAYESHSGGIIQTLQGLLDKASAQLETAQKKEEAALHNFEMQKQSLEDEIKYANKELDESKASIAANGETKATAEGDLSVARKDLAEDLETVEGLHKSCMEKAGEYETETKSRGEELDALAKAKEVLGESTGGATEQAYSFLQVVNTENPDALTAVRFVRRLATKQNSAALSQLASRMASVIRMGARVGNDPFAKVKTMVKEMIDKLEKDGKSEASHKAFCDEEIHENTAKKDDKSSDVRRMSSKIESMEAQSAQLKEEVAELEKELAQIAKSQYEMDALRGKEKAAYDKSKPELEAGVEGVKKAIAIIKDYYGGNGGGSIINLLEVAESDFSKLLSELNADEAAAVRDYDSESYSNEMQKNLKGQDVKYKTKEAAGLDKGVAELKADRAGVQSELDSVLEQLAKLNDMCVAKAEPYAEKVARRNSEIAGLREALAVLDDMSLLQKSSKRTLRGIQAHA